MILRIGLLCFCLLTLTAKAQYNPFHVPKNLPDRDSLKDIIQTTKDPLQKLEALRELGHAYYENKRDSALYFFEQNIAEARRIGSKLWEADACNSIGFVSYVQGNYPRALQFLTQAMKIAEDPVSEKGEWKIKGAQFVSPEYARLSILARSYQHQASLYGYTGNFKENAEIELNLFRKALSISTALRDTTMMGIINMNISRHYTYGNNWDSILFYHNKAIALMNKAGYSRYIGNAMYNLGEAYRRAQQFDKAKLYYWQGIEWGNRIENTRSVADNALALANVLRSQGNQDSAIAYAYTAVDRYRTTLMLNGLAESYATLSAAFNAKNKIDSAFHYQGLSLAARKELDAEDKARRFQQISFDEQMKAQEAAETERRFRNRIIMSILLAGLAILAAIGVFLYRNNMARKKANQLLAEKNRELEIESSLDRVRTRAMALHKSEDLHELIATVYQELGKLDISLDRCFIMINHPESGDTTWWMASHENPNVQRGYLVPYHQHPPYAAYLNAWKNGDEKLLYILEGQEKAEWDNFLFSETELKQLPDFVQAGMKSVKRAYWYSSFNKFGCLGIGSLERLSDQSFDILQRFSRVFEQTYTRFLDLQKAEASAREAQIEAALEKVRARSMAMHKSEELKEVIQLVYDQMLHLKIPVEHTGFIIDYKQRDNMHIWLADQNSSPTEVSFPYFDAPHWNSFIEAKKTGASFFANHHSFEEKNAFYTKLFDLLPGVLDDVRDFYFNCPGLDISTVLLDNIGLYIENFSGKPYTDEENAILMRFGKVFQQTYTRFIDLQKAEASAREAQIETALERIRARAMAMHTSSELVEVANVLREQMGLLNQPDLETSAVLIFHDDLESWESWYAFRPTRDATGKIRNGSATFSRDSCAFTREIAEHFLLPETEYTLQASGAKREEWISVLMKAAPEIAENAVNEEIANFDTTFFHFSDFKGGSLLTVSYLPPSDEIKSLQHRAAKVFDLAFRRFLDLKKAEAQAREAQIEAALERIRSRSMAMHKSEELADLSMEVVKQIQVLGVPTWFCAFNIHDDDPRGSLEWGSNAEATFPKYRTPREGIFIKYYEAWRRGEKLLVNEIGEDECPAHYEYLCSLPGVGEQLLKMKEAGIPFPTYQIDHVAYFKYGYILFITYQPVPETHEIFKRFAKVFEQSYTRFLDLQKAEAQAREAQIEAALERVRSRSLAMHHTNELQDVVNVAAQQLLKMDIDIDGGMFIAINEEVKDDLPFWAAAGAADYVQKVTLPFLDRPTFKGLHSAILRREPFYTEYYSTAEKNEFLEHMFRYDPWKQNSEERKRELLAREGGYTRSVVINKYTSIGITNHHGKIFSDAENDVLRRFGAVLEQSYTRFLDLQKAEAQAREAQIQLALERARSQSMAMQRSAELYDTLSVFHEQVLQLGISSHFSFLWLPDEEKDRHIFWAVWAEADSTTFNSKAINYPMDRTEPATAVCLADWKGTEPVVSYRVEQEGVENYFAAWSELIAGVEELKPENFTKGLYYVEAFIRYGCFGVMVTNELKEDEKEILHRLAAEFESTYTRFLDLKKAEAQARESQIELGLERVRARAMAMQTSKELSELVDTVFKELTKLDFALGWCIINIIDESTMSNTVWAANPNIDLPPDSYHMLFEDYPFHDAMMRGWKERRTKDVYILEGEEKKVYDEYLFNETEFRRVPPAAQAASRAMEKYVVSFTFSNFGGLQTVGEVPLSDDNIDILSRFGKVFDLTYTRFNDLQKAEAQAREAKIEAALEKVRSRTMAMQKSSELPDAANVLFLQVQSLGIPAWSCGYNILAPDKKSSTCIMSSEGEIQVPFVLPLTEHWSLIPWYEAIISGREFFVYEQGGEDLVEHYRYLGTVPGLEDVFKQFDDAGISLPTHQINHLVKFTNGFLLFITYEQVPEAHEIFKRFGKVFEQTYTRFLDLQKAEAQAREAQIEASLERVRSRSMAMHNTSELQAVIDTVHKELTNLNMAIHGGSFITINADIDNHLRLWGSGGTANTSSEVELPFYGKPFCMNLINKIRKGPGFFTEEYTQEEKREFFSFLFNYEPWSKLDAKQKEETLSSPGGYTRSCCVSRHTSIFIINHFGEKFSAADNDILKRFAKVFEQTYTRFLDLQKAEAQAKEAQIEAALERVRSRTLAMQKSEELGEVASILFKQMNQLVHNLWTCGFVLCEKDRPEDEWWLSMDGDFTRGFFLPNVGNYAHATLYEGWLKGETARSVQLDGEALQKHYDWLMQIPVSRAIFEEMDAAGLARPDWQKLHAAYFSNGYLVLITREPCAEEEVFKRFAAVFNLAYTRFKDLQISEAHALQAEKDLIAIKDAKQKAEVALTELQATQKQLIQAEKMASLGELTAGIAHEIQNPLNFVNNFSSLNTELVAELKEAISSGNWKDAEEIIGMLSDNEEKILQHGKRADAIVKGMLQHTRSGSGTKEPTDINALCDEYLRLAFHGFRAKDKSFNSDFSFTPDPDLGKINAVPQEIGRVILNLISNAFYAVHEKAKSSGKDYQPAVKVMTRKTDGLVVIAVADNGTGIPQKVVDKIFQPFFTTKPTGEGTGLGLSLSYDIVKAHGGELKVETKEGEGTAFVINLPANSV